MLSYTENLGEILVNIEKLSNTDITIITQVYQSYFIELKKTRVLA